MKWKLLSIIEYHAHAIHGMQYNAWYGGRLIDKWADPWILEDLAKCFSHYNKEGIGHALFATMDLFRLVAVEVAVKLGFEYLQEADNFSTAWVMEALRDCKIFGRG